MVTSIEREETGAKLKPGWRMVRFGDVVSNADINERDPLTSGLERYVGLEHLDPASLHIQRWGLIEEGTSFTRTFVAGQVLFGKRRAYQRKVAVADFDGICSSDILVFEAKDDLLPELLPFIVQSDPFYEYALNTSAGSLSPRTKWKDLAEYEFALPPKDEQRRIADILWAADEAIGHFNDSFLAQKTLKEILMVELFEVDQSISHVNLASIGSWVSGGTPSRSRRDFWNGNISWVSPKDMKVEVLTDTLEHVTETGVDSGSRMIPAGSILIVVRGMILAHTFPIAIAGIPVAFNQDMKALLVSEDFNPKYIYYWLQFKSRDILKLVSDSSHGTKRITTEQLFKLQVSYLPSQKQNEIVNILQDCDAAMEHFRRHIIHLGHIKNGLLENLLK